MISSLYKTFQHWSDGGSIWIISDTHFEDKDCKYMDSNWVTPEEQVKIINNCVLKSDYLIHLGDVGNPKYMEFINAHYKVLLTGNHDRGAKYYKPYFDEIFDGPLFISDRILLSHEPISLPFVVNIHGHDHNNVEHYEEKCKHLNVAANVCNYTPINLGKIIKQGILADIPSIHRMIIDRATERKIKKDVAK